MKELQKQWLGSVPWDIVLSLNQTQCEAQSTKHEPKRGVFDEARQLWQQSVSQTMSLPEVLDVCRKCQELGPFIFNNANTFAAVCKNLVEELAQGLPGVEAQILRTTVCHYVAGQAGKRELLQVLRHFENRWTMRPPEEVPAPVVQEARSAMKKTRIMPSLG